MSDRFALVAGPFTTRKAAEDTVTTLGKANHGIFSRYKEDAEGYITNEQEFFVERDKEAMPELIFGRTWDDIQAMQQGRR